MQSDPEHDEDPMRLTIFDHTLTDPRFGRLGQSLGITRHAARGHCEPVYMRCYSLRTNLMDARDVDALAEITGFGAAMVDASLARVIDDTKLQLWICGVADGMRWLLEQDRKRELALAAKRSRGMSPGESAGASHRDVTREVTREVPAQEQEQARDQDQVPDRISALAALAVGEINRPAGTNYRPDAAEVLKNCKALAKSGVTAADITLVIAAKAREWLTSDKMRDQFKPSVLLRPSNFARYREDLNARRPAQARRAAPTGGSILFDDGSSMEVPA